MSGRRTVESSPSRTLESARKAILFTAFFLIFSLCAFAQEENVENGLNPQGEKKPKLGAVVLGLEINGFSRNMFSEGAVFGLDFNLPNSYGAAGVTMSASYNFDGMLVLEPAVLIRFYFPFRGQTDTGFFGQADVGACIIIEEGILQDGDIILLFSMGLRAGYRFLLNKRFIIEPYARITYPSVFGIGVTAGVKF
ncbi:MAG: autotransporter outer membrane beta-barrel domain-containing protein [Treponema sp.]|nr:autotransporter outer membrane beta-barrel domain-containing protein [Treponema sp.]